MIHAVISRATALTISLSKIDMVGPFYPTFLRPPHFVLRAESYLTRPRLGQIVMRIQPTEVYP